VSPGPDALCRGLALLLDPVALVVLLVLILHGAPGYPVSAALLPVVLLGGVEGLLVDLLGVRKGVHPEADAPANERPIEPPSPNEDVYDEQGDVDHNEGAGVDVEALEGLDAGVRSVVALLLLIPVCSCLVLLSCY
jgi:hypothetical protein